jgi:penicillin amidase
VKGASDERLAVRVSRHGPVISDVSRAAIDAVPRGYALAMAWTALAEDDLTMQAALKLPRARNWQEFLAAARELHAPPQSGSYADVDGNIGFIAAGRVPVRKPANDLRGLGSRPGLGRALRLDRLHPVRAAAAAVQSAVRHDRARQPQDHAPRLSPSHHLRMGPRRIARGASRSCWAKSAARPVVVQGDAVDAVSLAVRELLPRFTAANPQHEVMKKLAAWDGTMAAGRDEPLIMTAWWREFARELYADELGDAFAPNWAARAVFVHNVLSGQSHWCDNVRTPRKESCDYLLIDSLETALEELRRRYGNDWRWGTAHVARHRHRPFSREPWLASLFDIAVPSAGDAYTVNAGAMDFNAGEPYANRHAASLRHISDLANPQASVFIHSGGQSGNPLSALYRNFTASWARGEYVPMITERPRLEADGAQRLVLTPRP